MPDITLSPEEEALLQSQGENDSASNPDSHNEEDTSIKDEIFESDSPDKKISAEKETEMQKIIKEKSRNERVLGDTLKRTSTLLVEKAVLGDEDAIHLIQSDDAVKGYVKRKFPAQFESIFQSEDNIVKKDVVVQSPEEIADLVIQKMKSEEQTKTLQKELLPYFEGKGKEPFLKALSGAQSLISSGYSINESISAIVKVARLDIPSGDHDISQSSKTMKDGNISIRREWEEHNAKIATMGLSPVNFDSFLRAKKERAI